MTLNFNGDNESPRNRGNNRLAKWLSETGELPPVAFKVPMDKEDEGLLEAAPSGETGEKWVTDWATREFRARYGGGLSRFEDQLRVADREVRYLENQLADCREALAKTVPVIVRSRTVVELPKGLLRWWLGFVVLILCSQTCLEWWSGATFATFELQSRWAALAFTFSMALAPVALKLFVGEASPWKRLLFISLTIGAHVGFVHVFTESYVSANLNLSADQLLSQIGQTPPPLLPLWKAPLDPRWRYMWQTILFTIIGFAFSNHLGRHVTVTTITEEKENPTYLRLEKQQRELRAEREYWGDRRAQAEGNQIEWRASLERHILCSLARFQEVERHRRDEEALENFLKQKAQRRNDRFRN